MTFQGVHHFVYAVKDIKATVDDYVRIFDIDRPIISEDRRGFHITNIKLGTLSFITCEDRSENPNGWFSRFMKRKGEGIWSIATMATERDSIVARLVARDIQIITEKYPGGNIFFFPHPKSTRGVYWEFIGEREGPPFNPSATKGWVKGLSHVGHAVFSIEAAVAMYSDLFGLRPCLRGIIPMNDIRARSLLLPIAENENLELLEPMDNQSPIAKWLEENGEGFHHVGLQVDNALAALNRLKDKGMKVNSGVLGGSCWIEPGDAHGVRYELG